MKELTGKIKTFILLTGRRIKTIIKQNRFYTAAEVIDIIHDKWKDEPEDVREYVDFIENIRMKPSERFKLNNSTEAGLLYSAYDDYF